MNQFSEAVLASVANTLWQGLAVVAIAWLGLRYTPRTNAATRHLIWWAVLAVILIMPAAPWLWHFQGPPHAEQLRTAAAQIPLAAAPEAGSVPIAHQPNRNSAPMNLSIAIRPGKWPARIFAVWLIVFLIQTARIVWSYRYLRGIRHRAQRATAELRRDFDVWMLACGVHRPVQLLVSREIVSPMAVGFRTPAVIVPEALLNEFSENELDHVFLHELAHLARRDDWSNLAARIGWAFLALHPAAAWVLRQIEREREIACDDWVVAATGEARPYAASLARLFELCFTRRKALLATGMAERASLLGDRIEMLLRRSREFTPQPNLGRLSICAGVLLLFVTVGMQAPRWIAFAQDEPAPVAPMALGVPAAQEPPAAPLAPAESPEAPAPPEAPAAQTPSAPAAPPAPANPPKGSFLAALVAAGYGNLSVDDIIALKDSGVSADFLTSVNRAGLGKLSPRELIDLHNNGVSPEYIRDIHDAGLTGLGMRDVIDLRNNGVDARYIHDVESAGLGTYTKQQIIQLHQSGVNAGLLRTLKDAGFRNVEPREIIDLHNNGVGERNFQEAKQYGANLTLKQIIRLKQAGVI